MLMPGGCPRKRGVNQAKWHMSNRDNEKSNISTIQYILKKNKILPMNKKIFYY